MTGWVPPHERPGMRRQLAREEADEARAADAERERVAAEWQAKVIAAKFFEAEHGVSQTEWLNQRQQASAAAVDSGQWRDPLAEYGSAARPELIIGEREILPRIPGGPVQASRTALMSPKVAGWFTDWHRRHDYAGYGEVARAVRQPSPYGPGWITRVSDSRARIVG